MGFCTVYPFWNPHNLTRPRISQFLILPPFQGKGHGGLFFDLSLYLFIYFSLDFSFTYFIPLPHFCLNKKKYQKTTLKTKIVRTLKCIYGDLLSTLTISDVTVEVSPLPPLPLLPILCSFLLKLFCLSQTKITSHHHHPSPIIIIIIIN